MGGTPSTEPRQDRVPVGVAAHGHTHPHLPLVTELVARGHRVTYAIPAPCADIVAATGAHPLVHSSVLPDPDHGEQWPTDPVTGMALFLDEAVVRACAEAFAPLGWDVVLAIGPHVDVAALGALPENVTVHRWVPQLGVLGRASGFVTHAGMGGCAEGLYQGVPMLAVPQAVDQFGNAAALEALGVARTVLPDHATPTVLRDALLELTSSAEVATRLVEQREELRRAGGAAAAADVVEGLI